MAFSVTAPLERQFGQVPGLTQMTSNIRKAARSSRCNSRRSEHRHCRAGGAGRINAAATYLPRDLPNPPVYSKTNPADAPFLRWRLTSDILPLNKVEDLADTRLVQKISQLPAWGW